MATELDVLGLVSDRLSALGPQFMLTGSFALACYATPRMTRDIDMVLAIDENGVERLVAEFSMDFYIDGDLVSREDLILSKLLWAQDSGSQMQCRDIRLFLDGEIDLDDLRHWAERPPGADDFTPAERLEAADRSLGAARRRAQARR